MGGPHGRSPIQTQRGKSGVKDARRVGENHVVGGASGALARSGVSTSVWFQEEAEVDVEELEPLQGYPHLLIEMRRKNQWRSPRRQTREHIDCARTGLLVI